MGPSRKKRRLWDLLVKSANNDKNRYLLKNVAPLFTMRHCLQYAVQVPTITTFFNAALFTIRSQSAHYCIK